MNKEPDTDMNTQSSTQKESSVIKVVRLALEWMDVAIRPNAAQIKADICANCPIKSVKYFKNIENKCPVCMYKDGKTKVPKLFERKAYNGFNDHNHREEKSEV